MTLLIQHWSYDPFLLVVAAVVALHERGLNALNRRAPRHRARQRRLQSLWFYLGCLVLLVTVQSPIDYWSDSYFWVHMVQHLLLIFAAPVPILLGAPWHPLQHGLPRAVRRPVLKAVLVHPRTEPARRVVSLLRSPWVSVLGLDLVVIVWHLPGPFQLAETNEAVHVWAMHSGFFVFGLLFCSQLVASPPLRVRLSPPGQMAAVFVTATLFWMLAMALSIFSAGSWYPWYQANEGPMLSPFADQQIGAGIMWTCGIFWAVPMMIVCAHRFIEDRQSPGVGAALEALLRGRRRAPAHAYATMHGTLDRTSFTADVVPPPGQRSGSDRLQG